jgi:hypothetical protein
MSDRNLRLFPSSVWQKIRHPRGRRTLRVCAWCHQVFEQRQSGPPRGCSPACSLALLFEAHVERTETCWIWHGTIGHDGYGRLSTWGGHSLHAHRYAYERFVGPIPEGLTLDHLCRNRACCNPAHLEAVTHKTNILRGEGLPADNARKTHCKHGHLLAGENVFVKANGGRGCKICRRRIVREYAQRQKARGH